MLTASATGYQAGTSTVSVQNIGINLGVSFGDCAAGANSNRHVSLSREAPSGGITVSLSSTANATVSPAQVVIPEGEAFSSTPVRITAVAQGSATVIATGPGLTAASVSVSICHQHSSGWLAGNSVAKHN